jgi:hypothetical protein
MIVEELLEIEHALVAGGGDEYREHLADDAVVIVPAQALDKRETVDVMERSPGWDEVEISEPEVREVGDAYGALMSSAYSKDDAGWKLVLHQQTPLWEK